MIGICMAYSWQVKDEEHRLRHKLFPPNARMKLTDFNVLTSCPKDELHQWFLGLYGEHIIPAMVHCYTQVLRIGCAVSLSSSYDEQGRFASALFSEVLLHRVYEPSPVPTLYVGRVEDLLGRVPLIPASCGRPLCGQNWEASTEVQVWGFQARMGN